MPTITIGTFFVRKAYGVTATRDAAGFALRLRLVDRQGRDSEAYVATWRGDEAQAWYARHGAELRAGTPLQVELANPRSLVVPLGTETHASVVSLQLAPVAPSWQQAAAEPRLTTTTTTTANA